MIIKLKDSDDGSDLYININSILFFTKDEDDSYTFIKLQCGSIYSVIDTPEQIEEKIYCSILRLEEEKAKINRQYRM